MPEQEKAVEPPPSSAPVTNGSRKHKTKEIDLEHLILEGHIRSIDRIRQVFEVINGKREFRGFETTITFHDKKANVDRKEIYPVLIEADSLYSGEIKIYKFPDGSYRIHDVGLKRIYE